MQTCNCSNTYKYKNECVICGEPWVNKTLEKYIDELTVDMNKLNEAYQSTNDLVMRDKYLMVREIIHQLNSLED